MMALRKSALLRLCAACVLLLGLGTAAYIYIAAPTGTAEGVGYVTEGGEVYDVRPEDSRSYLRNLEYIGGKSAVFATQLRETIAGLWSGFGAALSIAALSVAGCVLLLRTADRAEERARRR